MLHSIGCYHAYRELTAVACETVGKESKGKEPLELADKVLGEASVAKNFSAVSTCAFWQERDIWLAVELNGQGLSLSQCLAPARLWHEGFTLAGASPGLKFRPKLTRSRRVSCCSSSLPMVACLGSRTSSSSQH